ncbi:S9 family peptidase [Virgibacillus salexigens]|uniref:S9 family peptidase n=1 Tax=Virgibacillus TaxID=84406 RepID=UPI0013691E9B|nr:prolyl oligopeptidase family serine peptidase [Virgibacillus massiliensis]MYL43801.1 prolyl oligopeptidase family serine peptidase [Virgibacillus massiliensis]
MNQLSDYLNINWVEQPKKIPNSNKLTYVHRCNGLPQLYEFNLQTRVEVPLVRTDGRVLSVNHSKSGQYTILGIDYNGNEKKQLFLYNHKDQSLEKLVYSLDHFHVFGDFSTDEREFIYTSYTEEDFGYNVYKIVIESGEKEFLFKFEGAGTLVKWMKNSDLILCQIQETNIDSSYYIVNITDSSKVKIGKVDKAARYQSLLISKDQMTGYLLSDVDQEYLQLYQFSLSEPQELLPVIQSIPWDIEEIKFSKDETKMVFTVNEGGVSSVNLYDIATHTMKKLEYMPMGVISHITWLDNNILLFLLKGPQIPGEVYMYDIPRNKLTRITDVGFSNASPLRKYNPEMSLFQSFDGREIPYFYYTKNKNPKRAIIYVHGGPENLSRADFNPFLQALVNNGVAVIVPNIRGSKGFGRTYLTLDDRRNRLNAVKDIKTLAEIAFEKHGIQRGKLGIMGRSYGGFIVNTVIGYYPELWAAAVSIVGISHIGTFLEKTGLYRRSLREYEYGFLSEDRDYFDEISPLHHVEQINVPLLLCHGQNDSRVPVEESIHFKEKLSEIGENVRLIISKEEGHQMGGLTSDLSCYQDMHTEVAKFLNKYLV